MRDNPFYAQTSAIEEIEFWLQTTGGIQKRGHGVQRHVGVYTATTYSLGYESKDSAGARLDPHPSHSLTQSPFMAAYLSCDVSV